MSVLEDITGKEGGASLQVSVIWHHVTTAQPNMAVPRPHRHTDRNYRRFYKSITHWPENSHKILYNFREGAAMSLEDAAMSLEDVDMFLEDAAISLRNRLCQTAVIT